MLQNAGLEVRWTPETKVYQRRETILHSSGSSAPIRHATATSTRHIEVTPDVAAARAFEERLQHAFSDGGFLVLTVRPSRMRWAEAELLRRFDLDRVSFDDLLFDALREEAAELEVDWSVIEGADGAEASSQDWKNLLHLVRRAGPKVAARLTDRRKHLLLVHPGLMADGSLRPDVDSGNAAGPRGTRFALPRPLGSRRHGRTKRPARPRSRRNPDHHARPAGQSLRKLDRESASGASGKGARDTTLSNEWRRLIRFPQLQESWSMRQIVAA
jgi:hypothetical protein